MATIQYKCDTCKREIALTENKHGITVFAKCVITLGCKGTLYEISRNPNTVRQKLDYPPVVAELDDYVPRRVFFEKSININRNPWKIEHNLGVSPAVTVYFLDEVTNQPYEINPSEYTVKLIDENNIEIELNTERRGLVHLIARSSIPREVKNGGVISNPFTVSNNGIMTFAVQSVIINGSIETFTIQDAIDITAEISIPSNPTKTVQGSYLTDGADHLSPWLKWDQIRLRKRKTYSVKTLNLLNLFQSAFSEIGRYEDIPDGSSFKITEIRFKDGQGYHDIESRELMLLLANDPYCPVDKIRDRIVDVGELLVDTDRPLYIEKGQVLIDENKIEKIYPRIEKIENGIIEEIVEPEEQLVFLQNPFVDHQPWLPENVTFDENTQVPSYANVLTLIDNLAIDFPNDVIKEQIGTSVNGLPLYGLRIFDAAEDRPIVGFSIGIHGDERNAILGIMEGLRKLLDSTSNIYSTDPVAIDARSRLAFYVAPNINPDAMSDPTASGLPAYGGTGVRLNANGVDLNDDWPFYWKYDPTENTGTSSFSQPETQAFRDWMELNDRVGRVAFWNDTHGWISRDTWGWLTEQHYDDENALAQCHQRSAYLYMAELMRKRTYTGLFATGFATGTTPKLREYRSARKPFLYTWVSRNANPKATCGLFEQPQAEYPGAHALISMDLLKSGTMVALDINIGSAKSKILTRSSNPVANNENSQFDNWFSTEDRLEYFSNKGLRIKHYPYGSEQVGSFVRSSRPNDISWPIEVAPGRGCVHTLGLNEMLDDTSDAAFFVVGGYDDSGSISNARKESFYSGNNNAIDSLPFGISNGALATDYNDLYFFGGYSGSYQDAVRKVSASVAGSWQIVGRLPVGIQRHTATYWKNGLFIVAGGRSSGGYQSEVRQYDSTTDTWTLIANLPSGRGWHSALIRNDVLWTFGGWIGSRTLAEVVKVDINTGTVTQATPLPFSRAEHAFAYDEENDLAYIILGRSGSTLVSSIYEYNLATETVSELNYDLAYNEVDTTTSNDVTQIDQPYLVSAGAYFNRIDSKIVIVGGENDLGDVVNTVYELSMEESELNQREVGQGSWGYIRDRSVFTGNAGDTYTVVSTFRNVDPRSETIAPYVRITIIVGPLGAIQRKVRLGYTVPPQTKFRNFSVPFELLAGESEFRVYVRHYGAGTTVDIGGLQVLGGRPDLVNMVPSGNSLVDGVKTYTVSPELKSNDKKIHTLEGRFSPHGGSQTDIDENYIIWDFRGELEYMRLRYVANVDYSSPDDPTKPFYLQAFPETGKLILEWSDSGVTGSEIFWDGELELNHATINREWRRDQIAWKMSVGDEKIEIIIYFYGKVYKKIFSITELATLISIKQLAGQTLIPIVQK